MRKILTSAAPSGDSTSVNPSENRSASADSRQNRLLRFEDSLLESAYLRHEHRRHRTYYLASTFIAVVLVAVFFWVDEWLVTPSMLASFRFARAVVLLPSCALSFIVTVFVSEPAIWVCATAVLVAAYGLGHPALLFVVGPDAIPYLESGIVQCVLIAFLLYGLPFRWSLAIVLLFGFSFGFVVWNIRTDALQFINFAADYIVYGFVGGAAAYRYELTSRREFIAQLSSRLQYQERLTAEAQRRRWLEVIPAFLRHELKNSMTAISSSIEMANRALPNSEAQKYLDRGQRSLQYTQRLLTQVADATSIEAALAQHEFCQLDLSRLIADRMQEYLEDARGWVFRMDIEPSIKVVGHADSLTQMIDKLVDNAMEHGDSVFPIRINLRQLSYWCELEISEIGDSLPTDVGPLFEAFVTKKARRGKEGNLGLGLFVARTIALSHHGDISAAPLLHATGASFVVRLPIAAPK